MNPEARLLCGSFESFLAHTTWWRSHLSDDPESDDFEFGYNRMYN